ncbi:MAG: class I SAM-dependent RNA methyltransferase, partial [Gemmatimonadaceae bacterium]
RLLQAGPDRVDPPCVHYTRDRCGGCQLQHLSDDAQRRAKATLVRDALQRIGGVHVDIPVVHAAATPWRYRTVLTLAMRRDRARTHWRLGLRAHDDPEAVFDLEDCLITDERVLDAWREVRGAAQHLPNADRLRGTIRWLGDGAAFVLAGAQVWPAAASFADACPTLIFADWTPDGAPRRVMWDRRADNNEPAASFMQVNPQVADLLRADVVRRTLALAPRTAVDAYSGIGNVAAELHAAGVIVTAIEVDKTAAAWCARHLAPPSRSVAARVEDAIARTLPADVVIVNPPRAGLDARVAAALNAKEPRPRALLYVSCDPATLARDVARLTAFSVAHVAAYDMFPQTAHVETLLELVPSAQLALSTPSERAA